MARKFSAGLVGTPNIGNLSVSSNTINTTQTNENLELAPSGTGVVQVTNHLQIKATGEMRLLDADDSAYVGFKSPATVSANKVWTLPSVDGAIPGSTTGNQMLSSNGAGTLSWVTPYITVTDDVVDVGTYYPTFTSTTSDTTVTAVKRSSTKLTYVPSTGTLFATIGQFPTVQGSTANSGQLTIKSTSSSTKATAGILMTDGIAATSTTTGTLAVTGGLGVSGTVYAASIVETSSIALKENLNPITDALDKIMQLVGYTYDRTDTLAKNEAGLIAEHVNQVLPEIVNKDVNGNANGIQYTKLTAYLVEAIKSLNTELAELKNKLG